MPKDRVAVELGQAIRAARLRKGIRQRDLADAIGIIPGHLCEIEIGRYRPSQDLLERILVELGAPNDEELSS